MKWLNRLFGARDPQPEPVLSVVCDCPSCGKAVCAVMYVRSGSLEPIQGAFSQRPVPTSEVPYGAKPRKRPEGEEKPPRTKIFDPDWAKQPEA